MKTLIINGSTKQANSTSGYFAIVARLFLKGTKEYTKLRTRMDISRVLDMLDGVDTILFALPVYCDSVPSNILYFFLEMEKYCKENNRSFNIYVITTCGFIEGKQSHPLFDVFENFCSRSGNHWCGGIGIGGGAMLNITKMMFFVWLGITAVVTIYTGLVEGNWFPRDVMNSFLQTLGTIVFFNSWAIFAIIRLTTYINKRKEQKIFYTRAVIPAFLFTICADVLFFVLTVVEGGAFKGWNRKL